MNNSKDFITINDENDIEDSKINFNLCVEMEKNDKITKEDDKLNINENNSSLDLHDYELIYGDDDF